jgi:hexosaminidase
MHQFGGYVELAPDHSGGLMNGDEWNFSFKYGYDRHAPVNVSWGPMGTYLKLADGQTVDVNSEPLKFLNDTSQMQTRLSGDEPALRLIPHPNSWEQTAGKCNLSDGINFSGNFSETVKNVISSFDSLTKRLGFQEFLSNQGVDVCFENVDKNFKEEEYELIVKSHQIKIRASHYMGYFYALISLLQLRQIYNALVPCGQIKDLPRFSWRGQHLDCARHYYEVESILRLLDLMALLKLNRFHWHMIDDESFRLELKSFPELAQSTGMRGNDCVLPGVFGGGKGPTGGTYSAEDVKMIVDHADSLGISVMPEIEIPAHAKALLEVIPELRDPQDQSYEESVQGYLENTINPAIQATWNFLEKIIPEIKNMFPFEVIHLGCDEMPQKIWQNSPAINKLKEQEGLESTEDVQEWTMRRAAGIVIEAGGRPAAWEEAGRGNNGGIGQGALLFSWSGKEPGFEAAKDGYEVVMCPAQHVYFDMAHTPETHEKGVNWAAFVSMNDALDWDPVPENEPELEQNIIGIQGELWSETVIKDNDFETMLAPRILALSEVAWSVPHRKRELNEFSGAAGYFDKIFDQLNWRCHELV